MNSRRIAIAACCLVVLGGLGHEREAAAEPQSSAPTSEARSGPKDPKIQIGFQVVNPGEMETKYGVRLGFTAFKSPDGVSLTVLYLAQDDAVRARQAFNEELARAAKVIERGTT